MSAAGDHSAAPPTRSGPPVPVRALAAAAVAIAVVLLIVLASGDSGTEKHGVDSFVKNTFLSFDDATKKEVVTGVVSGAPFGHGSTNFTNEYPVGQEEALRNPTQITGRYTFLLDEGVVYATARYTLEGVGSRDARFAGRLTFTGGTRKFAGAKGSAAVTGQVFGAVVPARSTITVRGQIEY